MKNYMKIFFLLTMFLGMNYQHVVAQHIDEYPDDILAPLDSVPNWVRERVTPEEYEIWKCMSSVFQVSYSFLFQNMSIKQRGLLYKDLTQMCESIKKGEYSSKKGELFAVSLPAPVDTSLIWRVNELIQIDDSIQFCNQRAIIYRSERWEKACVECSVWYIYNSRKKDVEIIKSEVLSPFSFGQFQGSVSFNLQKDGISLKGVCSGNLQYYDELRNYHSETVYKSVIIPLKICDKDN